MDYSDILLIASAVVLVVLFWAVITHRHLKHLSAITSQKWEEVFLLLRMRTDLIPLLVELSKKQMTFDEKNLKTLIRVRMEASKEEKVNARKIELEHELSALLRQIWSLLGANAETKKESKMVELKTDFQLLEKRIEEKSLEYNEAVRKFNKRRNFFIFRPIAAVFGLRTRNIFEFEKM